MYNDLFSIGGLTVHGYGLCIGIGIASAVLSVAAGKVMDLSLIHI